MSRLKSRRASADMNGAWLGADLAGRLADLDARLGWLLAACGYGTVEAVRAASDEELLALGLDRADVDVIREVVQ